VVLLPAGLLARVRGVQTHKAKLERAQPGSRVAVNLAGIELAQVRRGMVLARPGTLEQTTLVDVRLRLLPEAALPLKHNAELKFFASASEVLAVARLLETDAIEPGETGWVQLQLAEPVALVKSDRFIVRRPMLEPRQQKQTNKDDEGTVAVVKWMRKDSVYTQDCKRSCEDKCNHALVGRCVQDSQ